MSGWRRESRTTPDENCRVEAQLADGTIRVVKLQYEYDEGSDDAFDHYYLDWLTGEPVEGVELWRYAPSSTKGE